MRPLPLAHDQVRGTTDPSPECVAECGEGSVDVMRRWRFCFLRWRDYRRARRNCSDVGPSGGNISLAPSISLASGPI